MAGASTDSPAFASTLSTSPEAGPSRQARATDQQPRTNALGTTTSRDSQAARASIDESLDVKRRKSSIFAGVHLNNKFGGSTRKRADTHESQDGHDEDQSPHDASPERRRDGENRKGAVVGNILDPEETDEGRQMEEEIRRLIKEAEEAQADSKEMITFLKDNRPYTPDLEDQFPPREYVWDVLFENQRGLYLFGKAYFSSVALLPFDPSPYTLPQETLEAASSRFLISHSEGNDIVPAAQDKARAPKRRSIKTAYTPKTFTVPTPAWEWLTPWMINMRTGTDELGWRYNGVFKKHGWSSKAGPGGWGGWVRRREWVRLRCVKPQIREAIHEVSERDDDGERRGGQARGLKEILGDDQDGGIWSLVKELEKVSLDREKLQMWNDWFGDVDGDTRQRVQSIINNPASLHTLKRQFTYRSSATHLNKILVEHGFHPPQASNSRSNPAAFSTPPPAPRGYEI